MKTRNPTQNPADAVLRKAFGIAMALQASSSPGSPRELTQEVIQKVHSYLGKFPPEISQRVMVREVKGRYVRESSGGPLCEMMIPPRGRLDGGGYFAAVLLKVLVVAHLETKGTHLPLNLKAWQRAAEQDPSTSGLRAAVRGHERQLSDALTSLFRTTHRDGQSRFTDLCRPCVEALNEPAVITLPSGAGGGRLPKEIAGELFGKTLVRTLTPETADADLNFKRANALSKLGKALQHKVEFLKAGGAKMVEPPRLPTAGESIGGLVSHLVCSVAEEEQLLDSICQAADKGDAASVLSLARELSTLRASGAGSKLSPASR